ncbi:hypothetical protein SESBI_21963 [Sesbania bispinosa]|nr:hypothetical protein SESBI_21963 [Sesbania bispinosa]
MSSFKACSTLLNLVAVVMFVAIFMSHRVEASRILSNSEEFAKANHLQTYTSSAYEQAKNTMAFWLQRLASGPSPKGPGH